MEILLISGMHVFLKRYLSLSEEVKSTSSALWCSFCRMLKSSMNFSHCLVFSGEQFFLNVKTAILIRVVIWNKGKK